MFKVLKKINNNDNDEVNDRTTESRCVSKARVKDAGQ